MSTETLTTRQRLIDTLCGDLNFQGWNQKNKLWFVKGDAGDEWLEFAGEFSGAPENHLVDLIGGDHADISGVVIATEGWAYPKKLTDTFKTEESLRSYWRLVPPDEHPEKVEIRHLLFASNDGEVIGLTSRHDTDSTKEWASLTSADPCPTGDRTVDAARALLGLNEPLKNRVLTTRQQPQAETASVNLAGLNLPPEISERMNAILNTVQAVLEGKMSGRDATLALFHSIPEEDRVEMLRDMPASIKAEFRELLSEEERKKYGL